MPVKILLVARGRDDRDRVRLALERLERSDGAVSFLDADDGRDALALAAEHHPDLVVVEVGVTPYGGFGVTRDIKANPDLSCPVLLVLERPQDEWLGRWCGADALVSRPIDPFALAQVASRLVAERSAPAGA